MSFVSDSCFPFVAVWSVIVSCEYKSCVLQTPGSSQALAFKGAIFVLLCFEESLL